MERLDIMMTKELLKKLSYWAGLSKEVREAIEYSVREDKTSCELWLIGDNVSKKYLKLLGFEVETVSKEGLTKEYITISWKKLN